MTDQKPYDLQDLISLRSDLYSYHNHKESSAYIAIGASLAFVAYMTENGKDPEFITKLCSIMTLCVSYLFVRWQLHQKRKAAVEMWVLRDAIYMIGVGKAPPLRRMSSIKPSETPMSNILVPWLDPLGHYDLHNVDSYPLYTSLLRQREKPGLLRKEIMLGTTIPSFLALLLPVYLVLYWGLC